MLNGIERVEVIKKAKAMEENELGNYVELLEKEKRSRPDEVPTDLRLRAGDLGHNDKLECEKIGGPNRQGILCFNGLPYSVVSLAE